MGGSNPYIDEVKYTPATKKYKVTFLPSGKSIEVDPEKIPYGHNGLPGSILDISEGLKAGLDHACGGVCACSTCHVMVKEGLESCNEATDAELDELDMAPGITQKSRLGCQTVPDGTTDIVVEIPEWNKNYAIPIRSPCVLPTCTNGSPSSPVSLATSRLQRKQTRSHPNGLAPGIRG